jgi:transposase
VRNNGGRPAKITNDTVQMIINAIRAGAYIETAAAYAGISKVTLYAWMKIGHDKPRSKYGEFLNAIDKAMADCIMRDLSVIDKSSVGTGVVCLPMVDPHGQPVRDHNGLQKYVEPMPLNWKAAAWRLERKAPRQWGRLERVEKGDPGDHQNEVVIILPAKEKLPPEDRDPDVPDGD